MSRGIVHNDGQLLSMTIRSGLEVELLQVLEAVLSIGRIVVILEEGLAEDVAEAAVYCLLDASTIVNRDLHWLISVRPRLLMERESMDSSLVKIHVRMVVHDHVKHFLDALYSLDLQLIPVQQMLSVNHLGVPLLDAMALVELGQFILTYFCTEFDFDLSYSFI